MVLVGVEDELSKSVARKLVAEAGFEVDRSDFLVERGAGNLRKHLPSYLAAGARRPVLVLTDLDDSECAPSLVAEWMEGKVRAENFVLRVAVREIEAWLLADRTGMHRFLGIPLRRVSGEPDEFEDPKMQLLLLAKGASAEVRRGLVRSEGDRVFRGLLYNKKLCEFALSGWSSTRAAANSASLNKAVTALQVARRKASLTTNN